MPLDIPDDLQKAAAAKSINDYLNHYITVIDAKAGAFLAGNVAAASVLVQRWPSGQTGQIAGIASMTLFAVSTLAAGGVIYPRIAPLRGESVIFWGDIAVSADAASYIQRFNDVIERGQLDEHYSQQNFLTARILARKFRWLRASVLLFFLALLIGFITCFGFPSQA